MEFCQREYFLSRIKLGYYILPYDGQIYKVYPATNEVDYFAQEEYFKALSDEDCLSQEEAVEIVIEEGAWDNVLENQLTNIIPKHIEYWKIEIYNRWFNANDRELMKKHLSKVQEEEYRLNSIKSKYYQHTREFLASYRRDLFILSNMTRKNKKRVNWHEVDITALYSLWQQSFLSPGLIKEIARSTHWTNYVLACKINKSKIFKPELTIEQKLLLQYTSFYHNIRKHPDCPTEEIVNDDDALDGWIILKNREAEAAKNKKQLEAGLGNKLAKAGEVYLPAQTPEEIKRIDSLNSPQAKMIKKQRAKQLANSKGTLRQEQFMDVQVDLLNQKRMHNG